MPYSETCTAHAGVHPEYLHASTNSPIPHGGTTSRDDVAGGDLDPDEASADARTSVWPSWEAPGSRIVGLRLPRSRERHCIAHARATSPRTRLRHARLPCAWSPQVPSRPGREARGSTVDFDAPKHGGRCRHAPRRQHVHDCREDRLVIDIPRPTALRTHPLRRQRRPHHLPQGHQEQCKPIPNSPYPWSHCAHPEVRVRTARASMEPRSHTGADDSVADQVAMNNSGQPLLHFQKSPPI